MITTRHRGPAMRRAGVVGTVTAAFAVLATVPAFAHVSVQPSSAAKGSYSTIAFKVPNERDDASTVKVEVTLPTDHPIASVSTQPVPGWEIEVTRSKLKTPLKTDDGTVDEAVTKIVWSGGEIGPGQFQQFPLSLGPLPEDADQLVFKALQTYSDKEVVRWIEETKEGEDEPENPAPALALTAASAEEGHSHGAAAGSDTTSDTTSAADDESGAAEDAGHDEAAAASSSDGTARALGVAGILIGAAGVAFGILAGRRRGTGTTTGTSTGTGTPSV